MHVGLNLDLWELPDLVVQSRMLRAIDDGIARYPIFRSLRFAARTELPDLFDDIALNLGWTAHRFDEHTMVLDGDGLFVSASGGYKAHYCSCYFAVWAASRERAEEVIARILARVDATRIREPMFSIDWQFLNAKGELHSASIEELADDQLHDEAYPEVGDGVARFVARYLAAEETVLVLQGPPGTGKTRLIRAILGEMSRRKGGKARALYTGDKKAIENDEIFVKFITGHDDAFVIEDADHLLKPRAEGNENLHRFLAIADGVVRAQGRKIIFSTNLPNVGDLDDALIRPGRCFARPNLRELVPAEAASLLHKLCAGDSAATARSTVALAACDRKTLSLAEIYKVLRA